MTHAHITLQFSCQQLLVFTSKSQREDITFGTGNGRAMLLLIMIAPEIERWAEAKVMFCSQRGHVHTVVCVELQRKSTFVTSSQHFVDILKVH